MKKAKIMLSAIGLISIVSGTLAFKAQHKFGGRFKCATTSTTTSCPILATTSGITTTTLYCTLATAAVSCSVPQQVSLTN